MTNYNDKVMRENCDQGLSVIGRMASWCYLFKSYDPNFTFSAYEIIIYLD